MVKVSLSHAVLSHSAPQAEGPITRLVAAFLNWRARQHARNELEALDDRLLADIGLNRGEIVAAVNGQYQTTASTADNDNRRAVRRPAA